MKTFCFVNFIGATTILITLSQVVACLLTFHVAGTQVASYFIFLIVSVFVEHIFVWLLQVAAAGNLHLQ
jgi:hypothetical protein